MRIEDLINLTVLSRSFFLRKVLPSLSVISLVFANYLVFMVVPNDRIMGAVQRIFYFHVASALTSYLMIALLLVASVGYLNSRKVEWDWAAEAAGLMGLVFCTVVLGTGMIWGHSAWNTWWSWEPRLMSFLVLWLILLSYVILRAFGDGQARHRNYSAVLGILAAVNVPIVIFSIKLLDQSRQLHPEVVSKGGLQDERFVFALVSAIVAMFLFGLWLYFVKLYDGVLRAKYDSLLQDLEYSKLSLGEG